MRGEVARQARLVNRVAGDAQRGEVRADEDAVAIWPAAEAGAAKLCGAVIADDIVGNRERRATQFPDAVVIACDDVVDDLQTINAARPGDTPAGAIGRAIRAVRAGNREAID